MTATLDVTCPACFAPPQSPCNAPTDLSRRNVGWYHSARTDLAIERDTVTTIELPERTLAEAIPFWDDWNPGIEHDLAALHSPGKSEVVNEDRKPRYVTFTITGGDYTHILGQGTNRIIDDVAQTTIAYASAAYADVIVNALNLINEGVN